MMDPTRTNMTSSDGLRIYDLAPQAASLVAVAGPDGVDPAMIDQESLPPGFRWLSDEEWSAAVAAAPLVLVFRPHQRPAWVQTFASSQELRGSWLNGEFARSCSAAPSEDYRDMESPTVDDAIDDLGHDLHALTVIRDLYDYEIAMSRAGHNWPAAKVTAAIVDLGWMPEEYAINGFRATMTWQQASRWNRGDLLDEDLDTIKIHFRDESWSVRDLMPVEDGGRDKRPALWSEIDDEPAERTN